MMKKLSSLVLSISLLAGSAAVGVASTAHASGGYGVTKTHQSGPRRGGVAATHIQAKRVRVTAKKPRVVQANVKFGFSYDGPGRAGRGPRKPLTTSSSPELALVLQTAGLGQGAGLASTIAQIDGIKGGGIAAGTTGMSLDHLSPMIEIDTGEAMRLRAANKAGVSETSTVADFDTPTNDFAKRGIRVSFRQDGQRPANRFGINGFVEVEFPVATQNGIKLMTLRSKHLSGPSAARELAAMISLDAYADANPIKIALKTLAPDLNLAHTTTTTLDVAAASLETAFAKVEGVEIAASLTRVPPVALRVTQVAAETNELLVDPATQGRWNETRGDLVTRQIFSANPAEQPRTEIAYRGPQQVTPGSTTHVRAHGQGAASAFSRPGAQGWAAGGSATLTKKD